MYDKLQIPVDLPPQGAPVYLSGVSEIKEKPKNGLPITQMTA